MKRNEALPSKYLSKEDFPEPVRGVVHTVVIEDVQKENEAREPKPVLYLAKSTSHTLDLKRGMVLNGTNWDAMVEITGKDDSDHWKGAQIVIFVDPEVRFGNKKVGGLRIRAPQAAKKVVEPPPIDEEIPPPSDEDAPVMEEDEIPF